MKLPPSMGRHHSALSSRAPGDRPLPVVRQHYGRLLQDNEVQATTLARLRIECFISPLSARW